MAAGALRASHAEIRALAANMVVVSTYWLSFEYVREPRREAAGGIRLDENPRPATAGHQVEEPFDFAALRHHREQEHVRALRERTRLPARDPVTEGEPSWVPRE